MLWVPRPDLPNSARSLSLNGPSCSRTKPGCQISYTRRMKSRTEYVRKEWVKEVRRQIATHKRFKRLIDQWLDLCIEHSQLTMQTTTPKPD